MTKINQLRVFMTTTAVVLALCLLTLVAAQPAEAAFPGKNGKIFFQSNRDGNPHIYSMKPDGTGLNRLTFTAANSDPAVSPDGTQVAFVSTDNQIFVMNADGSGRTQITTTQSAKQDPTWSHDGTRIAFVANSSDVDGQTDLEIWTINADGSGRSQLTNNSFPDTDPAWSPLGDQIAFVSNRTGDTDRNVYVMNADGSGQNNITPNAPYGDTTYQGHDEEPAWSPDGSKIAYIHTFSPNASGVPNVWTMDPNGANKINISNNQDTSAAMPAWSPDGTRIAYVGAVNTDRNIYIMNADGSGQLAIYTNPSHDINPDWQQDSIPPQTTITSGPSGATNSTSASFDFVSSETGSTFECSLDGGAFAPCSSPASYSDLTTGSHTLSVRATDVAGNVDPTPASRSWTVDTTPPNTSITSGPTSLTKSTSASFGFSSSESGSRFQCSLDGAAYSACASPKSYTSLKDGSHTFKVRAIDAAGNVDATPAIRAWTVDTTAPAGSVKINGGAAYTKSPSVKLSLSATDPSPASGVASMRFMNDGGSWSGWMSYATSKSWTLKKANGTRTVYVQYRDKAGNVSTAAVDRIKLDMVKPTVSGMSPKHGSITRDTTPTIKATVRDNMTNLAKGNIKLYVAGKAIPASKYSYSASTDQLVYNSPKLSKGKKTVKIVATDKARNVGARSWYFTIK